MRQYSFKISYVRKIIIIIITTTYYLGIMNKSDVTHKVCSCNNIVYVAQGE